MRNALMMVEWHIVCFWFHNRYSFINIHVEQQELYSCLSLLFEVNDFKVPVFFRIVLNFDEIMENKFFKRWTTYSCLFCLPYNHIPPDPTQTQRFENFVGTLFFQRHNIASYLVVTTSSQLSENIKMPASFSK